MKCSVINVACALMGLLMAIYLASYFMIRELFCDSRYGPPSIYIFEYSLMGRLLFRPINYIDVNFLGGPDILNEPLIELGKGPPAKMPSCK